MLRTTRRTLALFGTLSFVLLLAASTVTQGRWSKGAPFPAVDADEEMYGIAANGKMYVMGGFGPGGNPRGAVYEYDPAGNTWTKKKQMPRPVHHQAMAELGGKIYVFGGFTVPMPQPPLGGGGWAPVDNAWEYDPAADTWTALPPMPTKRGSALAFQVNGRFYVIGGAAPHPGSTLVAITGDGPGRSVATNEMYDPAAKRWETRQTLPTARNHAFGGVVNGKIYVIGGRIGHSFITVTSNTDIVEEYDPAIDSWGPLKARMPSPRSGGGWATYNGKIYVAGGEVATPQLVGAYRAVEAYSPATNTWEKLPSMPMPRHGVAGAFIGNRFHLVSGGITSAAAGAGGDPGLSPHTTSHDVLEVPSS
jgi:N-acetylneuraminic acid mutarotase